MRSLMVLGLVLCSMHAAQGETYTSTPTILRSKTIYARAEGKITKLNFAPSQVFLWDEFAAHIEPSKSPRPEFGRAYADFAGAVSRVLVEEGQYVQEGEPLYECRFLERVYTTCVIPTSKVTGNMTDQKITAVWRGEEFDARVLDTATDGNTTVLYIVIYNTHEHRYWHLTHGQTVSIEIP